MSVEEAIGDLPVLHNGDMIDSLPYTKSIKESSPYAQQMRKGSIESKQNFVSKSNDLVMQRYKYIGQGENWRAIPESLMRNYSDKTRCHSGIYKRLKAIQIRMVDAGFYTSWIKGKIHFKDQRLEDIMKILSRWYDMEVIFANEKIKDLRFGCNVDRYSEITPFVRLLEETQKVHVKVNNKTITFYN